MPVRWSVLGIFVAAVDETLVGVTIGGVGVVSSERPISAAISEFSFRRLRERNKASIIVQSVESADKKAQQNTPILIFSRYRDVFRSWVLRIYTIATVSKSVT